MALKTFQQLLANFTAQAIHNLENNLITLREVDSSNITKTVFLDFLLVKRDLNGQAFPIYSINLSSNKQPNFVDHAVPAYKFLELGKIFQFELKDSDKDSLIEAVEKGFDNSLKHEISLKEILLIGLFQLSYKSIEDEEERRQYILNLHDESFSERLLNYWKLYENKFSFDEDSKALIEKLDKAIDEAIAVIRADTVFKLDADVVQLAKACKDNNEFSFFIYRTLLEGILKNCGVDDTKAISFNPNAVIVKAITTHNLTGIGLSQDWLKRIKNTPASKIYSASMWLQSSISSLSMSDLNTVCTVLKYAVIRNEELGKDEPSYFNSLFVLEDAIKGISQQENNEHLLRSLAWFEKLIHNNKSLHSNDVISFAIGTRYYPSINAAEAFKPHNLELVGKWTTQELLQKLISDWASHLDRLASSLDRNFKLTLDQKFLNAISDYNIDSDNFKIHPILNSNEAYQAVRTYKLNKGGFIDDILGHYIALKIRDELKPEQLVLIKFTDGEDKHIDKVYFKPYDHYISKNNFATAKDTAIMLREIHRLNDYYHMQVSKRKANNG